MILPYEHLLEQLENTDFKPVTFGIFNFIEKEGFVVEASGVEKRNLDIDDFEYYKFNLTSEEVETIKISRKEGLKSFTKFKKFIENTVQENDIKCKIYIIKDSGSLIAVKVKGFVLELPDD